MQVPARLLKEQGYGVEEVVLVFPVMAVLGKEELDDEVGVEGP